MDLISQGLDVYQRVSADPTVNTHEKRMLLNLYVNLLQFLLSHTRTQTVKIACLFSLKTCLKSYSAGRLPEGEGLRSCLDIDDPDVILVNHRQALLNDERMLYQRYFKSDFLRLNADAFILLQEFIDQANSDDEPSSSTEKQYQEQLNQRSTQFAELGLAAAIIDEVQLNDHGSVTSHDLEKTLLPDISPEESFAFLSGESSWNHWELELVWPLLLLQVSQIKLDCYAASGHTQQCFQSGLESQEFVLSGLKNQLGERCLHELFHAVNFAKSLIEEQSIKNSQHELKLTVTDLPLLSIQVVYAEEKGYLRCKTSMYLQYSARWLQGPQSDEQLRLHFDWQQGAIKLLSIAFPSVDSQIYPDCQIHLSARAKQLMPKVWPLLSESHGELIRRYSDARGKQNYWLPWGFEFFGFRSRASQVFNTETPRDVRSLLWKGYPHKGASHQVLNEFIKPWFSK